MIGHYAARGLGPRSSDRRCSRWLRVGLALAGDGQSLAAGTRSGHRHPGLPGATVAVLGGRGVHARPTEAATTWRVVVAGEALALGASDIAAGIRRLAVSPSS